MDLLSISESASQIAMKIEAEDQSVVQDLNSLIASLNDPDFSSPVEVALNSLSLLVEDISKNKNTFFNYLKTRIASNRCIDFDFIDYFAKVQNPDLTNVEDLLDENKRFTTDERNHQYYYYLSMKAIQTKNPAIIQKAIDILQSLS